jgi:hypothetical protein
MNESEVETVESINRNEGSLHISPVIEPAIRRERVEIGKGEIS